MFSLFFHVSVCFLGLLRCHCGLHSLILPLHFVTVDGLPVTWSVRRRNQDIRCTAAEALQPLGQRQSVGKWQDLEEQIGTNYCKGKKSSACCCTVILGTPMLLFAYRTRNSLGKLCNIHPIDALWGHPGVLEFLCLSEVGFHHRHGLFCGNGVWLHICPEAGQSCEMANIDPIPSDLPVWHRRLSGPPSHCEGCFATCGWLGWGKDLSHITHSSLMWLMRPHPRKVE